MSAPVVAMAGGVRSQSQLEWEEMNTVAPRLTAVAARYLDQIALSLRPGSVVVIDRSLRTFCRYLIEEHPETTSFRVVARPQIEGFKAHLGAHITEKGKPLSPNSRRQCLSVLRVFFDRIIEWEWDDGPPGPRSSAATCPRRTNRCPSS